MHRTVYYAFISPRLTVGYRQEFLKKLVVSNHQVSHLASSANVNPRFNDNVALFVFS